MQFVAIWEGHDRLQSVTLQLEMDFSDDSIWSCEVGVSSRYHLLGEYFHATLVGGVLNGAVVVLGDTCYGVHVFN